MSTQHYGKNTFRMVCPFKNPGLEFKVVNKVSSHPEIPAV